MRLQDLFEPLTESETILVESFDETLSEEQLNEKSELIGKMLSSAFKIPKKYITELSTRQGYNISLSHLCDAANRVSKCLSDMRNKMLKAKFLQTFDVELIDDVIELRPAHIRR